VFIWLLSLGKPENLSVSFLNVGQGDAILIKTPNDVQILIDGGSGAQILRALQKEMPFFDRSIDVIVATHPDRDHIGGLPDVFKRFYVATYIESGVYEDSDLYGSLRFYVEEENAKYISINAPTSFVLDGVQFDILFPDRSVHGLEKNSASIVMRVTYGNHSFLLMGDAPKSIERYLVWRHGEELESDVLKVGHHGSKTSSAEEFIATVNPSFAVISAGKDNRYGHPHKEVLSTFKKYEVRIVSTMDGSVVFETDGEILIRK
jgi:competence protein ComEC